MSESIAIDLSTELAEAFVLPPGGIPISTLEAIETAPNGNRFHPRHGITRFDDALLPHISSAHLCCGFHSGDPVVLARLIPRLVEAGIQIGAHPSYPDVFNFGQYRVEMSVDELVAALLYQFGALQGVLQRYGSSVRHVKCHGALAFDVAYEQSPCKALVEAIQHFDPEMVLVAMAGSPSVSLARAAGIRVIEEGFADRGYDHTGRIVPRDHPRALLTDGEAVASQVLAMARGRGLVTADGGQIDLHAQTFCLHSDTPGAGQFAARLREALRVHGVSIKPIAELV